MNALQSANTHNRKKEAKQGWPILVKILWRGVKVQHQVTFCCTHTPPQTVNKWVLFCSKHYNKGFFRDSGLCWFSSSVSVSCWMLQLFALVCYVGNSFDATWLGTVLHLVALSGNLATHYTCWYSIDELPVNIRLCWFTFSSPSDLNSCYKRLNRFPYLPYVGDKTSELHYQLVDLPSL